MCSLERAWANCTHRLPLLSAGYERRMTDEAREVARLVLKVLVSQIEMFQLYLEAVEKLLRILMQPFKAF